MTDWSRMRRECWIGPLMLVACYGEPTRPADTLVAHLTGAYKVSMRGRDGHTACPEAMVTFARDTITWTGCSGPAIGGGERPGRRDGGLGEVELGIWILNGDGVSFERQFVRKFHFTAFTGSVARSGADWTGPCLNAVSPYPEACAVESGSATWVME
jgi:hypothetical protein